MKQNSSRTPTEVKDAIECLTTIPTKSLSVRVQNRWVYLSGTLRDHHQRQFVGELVQHLDGVDGVTNLIAVEPDPVAQN